MEQENYELNIESWASSLMELEETGLESEDSHSQTCSHSALVSLAPTYYRSKAFSSNIGINNLINAADPLLTLVTKLRRVTYPPDVITLHQNISHEVKAFENKAQTLGYRPQLVLAARFVICALLDELITLTLWPDQEWKKYSLVDTFHKDSWDEDRFFLILERGLQDATAHIDLLELIYLCLRLGYEGKYRGMERGLLELRGLTDHLYSTITHHREEFSRSLHISSVNLNLHPIKKKNFVHLLPPVWLLTTLMVIILLTAFTFFYLRLVEAATPLSQYFNTLKLSPDIAPKSNSMNP